MVRFCAESSVRPVGAQMQRHLDKGAARAANVEMWRSVLNWRPGNRLPPDPVPRAKAFYRIARPEEGGQLAVAVCAPGFFESRGTVAGGRSQWRGVHVAFAFRRRQLLMDLHIKRRRSATWFPWRDRFWIGRNLTAYTETASSVPAEVRSWPEPPPTSSGNSNWNSSRRRADARREIRRAVRSGFALPAVRDGVPRSSHEPRMDPQGRIMMDKRRDLRQIESRTC